MSDLHPARHRRSCNEPGHAHELTFTCYRRFRFLSAERACRWLGDAIHEARRTLDFAFWAFVFMPEHAHLIVCPQRPGYEMATILKAIKEPVGRHSVSYIAEHAPACSPDHATTRRADRTLVLAIRWRIRSEHLGTPDPDVDDRLHPHEPRPAWPCGEGQRLALVECGLVRGKSDVRPDSRSNSSRVGFRLKLSGP